jgi:TolA-binding protein
VAFEDALSYVLVAVGAVALTALTMYAMMGRKKTASIVVPKTPSGSKAKLPFPTEHTVSSGEAQEARDKLRTLELEREILSDAIRRLYEAQVEGKITEQERDRLAESYKTRMLKVKDAITKSQSVVALQELEGMQEDLVKLFDDRFDELNMKIEEMRQKVKPEAEEETPEIPVSMEAPIEEEEEETPEITETGAEPKSMKKRRPKPKPAAAEEGKTEAEKRIDQIRAEVEKVLERLGQMEVET